VSLTHGGRKGGKVFHRWPEMLPDGKHFLYLTVASPGRKDASGRRYVLMAGTLDGGPASEIGPIESRVVFHGGKLLYVRNGTLVAHAFDVQRMSLEGDPAPLVDGVYNYTGSGVAAFAVSRSGTIVYRRPRGESRLIWFERGGLQGAEVDKVVLGRQPGSLSPDGKRYATGVVDIKVGGQDIWIYDLVRRNSARFTYGDADDTRPVWSADGRSLFFRSDSADGGSPPDVYRQEFGSETKQLVVQGPDMEEPSGISSDGEHLLVEDWNETTGNDILVVSLKDGKLRDFAKTPFGETNARFSPDGKWVALGSTLSGSSEVYLFSFPLPGTPLRVSSSGGARPRWNGDGSELFYQAGAQVMSVEVRNAGGRLQVGEPRPLFRAATGIVDFEVVPDGSRFLIRTPEERTPEVHLILNALPAQK
jgi:eukaryotic-like serine/threonine-protein kinase